MPGSSRSPFPPHSMPSASFSDDEREERRRVYRYKLIRGPEKRSYTFSSVAVVHMTIERREWLVALGLATGLASVPGIDRSSLLDRETSDSSFGQRERETLMEVAAIVYPTAADYDEEFVMSHVESRSEARQQGIYTAVDDLNAFARQWYGRSFPSLSSATQRSLLRDLGVGRAGADPDSTATERIRYYVVNQLLFALYTDPRGSRLFGVDNPRGYPGGYESYQEPSER